MQLRGWGLTRASRIAIILLVVEYLGLGQVLAFAPATTSGTSLTTRSPGIAAPDSAVLFVALLHTVRHPSAVLGVSGSRAIPPDPAPLPHRLPRASPAP